MKNWMLGIALVSVLAGCANQRLSNQERASLFANYLTEIKAEELKRINSFRFYGWRELGNQHLIISTSLKRHYFLTLRGPCLELSFAYTIGINRSGSSLNAMFDSIFVPTIPEQRCPIKTIHKITRDQADKIESLEAERLAESTKKPKKT